MTEPKQAATSQTLSRGLTALEVLAESATPISIGELSSRLGLHRSITYRLVRTLELHRLVVRTDAGEFEPGARLAALARNVRSDLQSAALPELTALANELGMTAFVAILDHEADEAVTLISVEPRHADAVVAQRPGGRHPIDRGAPGRAIRRQLRREKSTHPYETSHDEVIAGLSSVAVPLATQGNPLAALAVVYLSQPIDVEAIGRRLELAGRTIRAEFE